jgi:hypothetical protein
MVTLRSLDGAGSGEDIEVVSGAVVAATNSTIAIQAGDNFELDADSTLRAGGTITITCDFGDADSSTGGTIDLMGTIEGGTLQLNGQGDDDTINIEVPSLHHPTSVNGQGDNDTLTLYGHPASPSGRVSHIYDGTANGRLFLDPDDSGGPGLGAGGGPDLVQISYSNLENVEDLLSYNRMDLYLRSNAASSLLVSDGPILMASATARLSGDGATVEFANKAEVSINGRSQDDTIDVDFTVIPLGLTSLDLYGHFQPGDPGAGPESNAVDTFNLTASPLSFSAFGEDGRDIFNVFGVTSGVSNQLNGGDDSDLINLGSLTNSLGSILGDVVVNGDAHGSGTSILTIKDATNEIDTGDILNLNDQGDGGSYTYTVDDATFTRTGIGTVTYDTIETINLNTSAGSADVDVLATGGSVNANIITQDDRDDVDVDSSGNISNLVIGTAGGEDDVNLSSVSGDPFPWMTGVGEEVLLGSTDGDRSAEDVVGDLFDEDFVYALQSGSTSQQGVMKFALARTGGLITGAVRSYVDISTLEHNNTGLKALDMFDSDALFYTLEEGGSDDDGQVGRATSIDVSPLTHTLATDLTNLRTGATADYDPEGIAIDRTNNFLYVATDDGPNCDVAQYSIDPASLGLTFNWITSMAIGVSNGNDGIVLSDGRYLGVSGSTSVTFHAVSQDGATVTDWLGGPTGGAGRDTPQDLLEYQGFVYLAWESGIIDAFDLSAPTTTPVASIDLESTVGPLSIGGIDITSDGHLLVSTLGAGGSTGEVYAFNALPDRRFIQVDGGDDADVLILQEASLGSHVQIAGATGEDALATHASNGVVTLMGGTEDDTFQVIPGLNNTICVFGDAPAFGDVGIPPNGDTLSFDLTGISEAAISKGITPGDGTAEFVSANSVVFESIEKLFTPGFQDFGDAPDSYSTQVGSDGARHYVSPIGPILGALADIEADGLVSTLADGDDLDAMDDEDGVDLSSSLVVGSTNLVDVSSEVGGYLSYFVDYNQDGVFDAMEETASFIHPGSGVASVPVVVPGNATLGSTFARFRISSASGLAAIGSASDGEVEDYQVTLFGASPSITCPSDIVVFNDTGFCGATVAFTASAVGTPTPTLEYAIGGTPITSPHAFDGGITIVDVTATNSVGTDTCSFMVTVNDIEAPFAICQDATVTLNATGYAEILSASIEAGSLDNCGIASIVVSPTSFTCADVGINSVTLTVTDLGGNSSVCGATVTVLDDLPPTLVCAPATAFLDAGGIATLVATDFDGGSFDNCAIADLAVTPMWFTCTGIGSSMVVLTATDTSGNSASCTTTVTIEDGIPPTAVCQIASVILSATGYGEIDSASVDGGSFDNCAVASIVVEPTSFTCADIGINSVTLTVRDTSGNLDTCFGQVMVQDASAPTVLCLPATVSLGADGSAILDPNDFDAGSFDNCSISSWVVSPTTVTCLDPTVSDVTLIATDQSGNSASCTTTVTIEDMLPPTAVCQSATVTLSSTGYAEIRSASIEGGSFDNCSIASIVVEPTAFTCADAGIAAVTLTVTDTSGNIDRCIGSVLVLDVSAPRVACMPSMAILDASGMAFLDPMDFDAGSTDTCGIQLLTVQPDTVTCADIGIVDVTLTATDASGNVALCTTTVEVIDDTAPVLILPTLDPIVADGGMAEVPDYTGLVMVEDNCTTVMDIVIDQSPAPGTRVGPGTTPIVLSATDESGNSSSEMGELQVIAPSPTPTVSPSVPPTATASPMPSVSATASPTPSVMATATPTASVPATLTPTVSPTPVTGQDCDSGYYVLDSLGGRHRVGNPLLIAGPVYFATDVARDMERAECALLGGPVAQPDLVVLDAFGAAHFVANPACNVMQDFYFAGEQRRAVDLTVSADSAGLWVLADDGSIWRAGSTKAATEEALLAGTDLGLLGSDVPLPMRDPNLNPGGVTLRAVSFIVIDEDRDSRAEGYVILDSQGGRFHFNADGTPVTAGSSDGLVGNEPGRLLDPEGYVWPFFMGLDIARDIEPHPSMGGVIILDGWGGIHPVPVNDGANPVFFANNVVSASDPTPIQAVGMPYVVNGFDDPITAVDESMVLDIDGASIFTDIEFSAGCPNSALYTLDKFGGVFVLGTARPNETEPIPGFGGSPYFYPYLYAEDLEIFMEEETGFQR